MTRPVTLDQLLAPAAGDAIALTAPGLPALTFAGLRALIDATIAALNEAGIGRDDRVAIVLPNGPEMATAFVAVAGASRVGVLARRPGLRAGRPGS